MQPIVQKEFYLAKAAGLYDGEVPNPVTTTDYYYAALCGKYVGELPEPVTAEQKYLANLLGEDVAVPKPITLDDIFMYDAVMRIVAEEPVTRQQYYWRLIAKSRQYINKTASGNPITLTDSAENKPLNMKLYGWSKQDGEPSPDNPVEIESAGMRWSMGKNLVNADDYYSAYKQADGTYKSKTVTLNDIRISLSEFVGKEITISVKLTVGANVSGVFLMYISSEQKKINGSVIRSGLTGKSILTITPVSNTDYFVISFGSGNDDVIFSELQLELSSVATSYEPYTGGVPKPYGDKVGVVVGGANIFSFENFTALETYIDSGYDVRNIQLKPDTMYYFYVPNRKSNAEVGVWLFQPKSENNINDVGFIGLTTNYEEVPSIKTDSTGILKIGCAFSLGIRDENYLNDNLIISLNPVDAYEPYRTPQSTSIITPNGLPGIPVPSNTVGITYTDADGQAWIADYIDFKHGKYIQNVRIKEFTGQESYIVAGTSYFSGSSANMYIIVPDMIRDGEAMCNCLSKKPYVWTVKSAVGFATNLQQIHLRFPKAIIGVNDDAVLEDIKIAYKKYIKTLYDNGKPVVVQYILANSIERDLTSAELAEYIQLYSYKPTTVVENDSDCWMDVTALCKPK